MKKQEIFAGITSACRERYGNRLISLAVFGSVGRGTARPDSDIDLLIIVEQLPARRRESGRAIPGIGI